MKHICQKCRKLIEGKEEGTNYLEFGTNGEHTEIYFVLCNDCYEEKYKEVFDWVSY